MSFKHQSKYYLLAWTRELQCIGVGDWVKVEADRGVDIGIVKSKLLLNGFKERKLAVFAYGSRSGSFQCVTRPATEEEESLVRIKTDEEIHATELCRSKIHELMLPMKVVDAEFQFDRSKLTFYFEAVK